MYRFTVYCSIISVVFGMKLGKIPIAQSANFDTGSKLSFKAEWNALKNCKNCYKCRVDVAKYVPNVNNVAGLSADSSLKKCFC